MRPFSPPDVTDEILEQSDHYVSFAVGSCVTKPPRAGGLTRAQTQAMIISTQHLLPSAVPTPTVAPDAPPAVPTTGMNTPNVSEPQGDPVEEAAKAAPARESSQTLADRSLTSAAPNTNSSASCRRSGGHQ